LSLLGLRESHLPAFDGATAWLNSPPLSADELRGKVVLVDFWTYTCINWLRTLAYVRAWADKYEGERLVVVGVHTPEFPFEKDLDNVTWATAEMDVRYPVAVDSDYAIWNAFANNAWPAVYLADGDGRIRYRHYGEGAYDDCERVIQELVREGGRGAVGGDLVTPDFDGFEVQAAWGDLQSPETYLGYQQGRNFGSPGGASVDEPRTYDVPDELRLNEWALGGDWTIGGRASVLNGDEGRIAFRFHARDVHLVMGPPARGVTVPFRVLVDGEPPGDAAGFDVDEAGNGILAEQRLYQLVREPGEITDRTFEITFSAPGAEGYCFTFG
jgi:thiol-disulfide isomerase/thioredoxin